jgi:hypothetical protein
MTISFEFNSLRHGRACPGHPRPARILLIGWHSAFFRILLDEPLGWPATTRPCWQMPPTYWPISARTSALCWR